MYISLFVLALLSSSKAPGATSFCFQTPRARVGINIVEFCLGNRENQVGSATEVEVAVFFPDRRPGSGPKPALHVSVHPSQK